MFTKVYGYYPLGFRRVLRPGERKLDSGPDDAVTLQYVKWQQDRAGFRSWATHEEAIKLAIQLFGDFTVWLREQQTNEKLSRHGWEFLLETIRFINTGERRINVHTHASLILMDVESFRTLPQSERKVKLVDELQDSAETVLAQWLRQPNGFSDMLCSLTVFFGNTQPSGALTWAS
jgi:hypothetical protein